MEAVHEKSNLNTHLPELTGLWSVPPTQTDVVRTYHELVEVKGDLDHVNELRFQTGAERDFIDLSESYVEIQFQVICDAGSIIAGDNLALTNNFAHGMWSTIRLTDKSGRPLSNLDEQRYPYQAMLLTLLGKNRGWGEGAGQLEGWYPDTAAHFEAKGDTNPGFLARKHLVVAANAQTAAPVVTVCFRPYLGMFQQRRLLLSDMSLRLSLTRAKPEFVLISAAVVAGARIRLTSAKWFVKRVELTPAATNFNIEMLSRGRALYPIDRTLFYQQQFTGVTSFKLKDIWSGPMPSHVVVGILSATSFAGHSTQNPYNFPNYGLTKIQLTAGSREIPKNAFEPVFNGTDTAGANVVRELLSTLEISGKAWGSEGNLLDLANYVGGQSIYAFDLTADGSAGAHWSLTHRGALTISGTFAVAPGHAVTVIAIGMVSSVIEIGADRSITTDFTE